MVKWHLRLDALPSTLCHTNGGSSEIPSGLEGPPSMIVKTKGPNQKEGLPHELA